MVEWWDGGKDKNFCYISSHMQSELPIFLRAIEYPISSPGSLFAPCQWYVGRSGSV